jgi:uncharacterized protein YukE
MEGDIRFDFSKAQGLLEGLFEYKRYLEELAQMLGREVSGIDQWWEGGSSEVFKDKYSAPGKGKSVIDGLSDDLNRVILLLKEISEAKRGFEVKSEKLF